MQATSTDRLECDYLVVGAGAAGCAVAARLSADPAVRASNLNDEMTPLRPLLEGRAEMLFFDRPGHGWSSRGDEANDTPDSQADTLAALMDQIGIRQAVIVGHSFGGSLVTAFALKYPERVKGLVFAAAATHPWPGGKTAWYYELTAKPVIGRLFVETLAYLGGVQRMAAATTCVFAPNRVPDDYLRRAEIALVLRPAAFRANAADVKGLYAFAQTHAPLYKRIAAPTVVISGDRDTVVLEEVHSIGLERDIPGAELIWVKNMGHKPDWVASDLIVAAIEKVSGLDRDLKAAGRIVEARIANDAFGAECAEPNAELAAQTSN